MAVPPAPGPDQLIGMAGGSLSTILGEPSFKRRDNPAEIWQYRGEDCVLDIFLYKEMDGAIYRVDHVEARTRNVVSVTLPECYSSLLRERAGKDG
ncbi:MAG: hypothetical protein V3R66_03675 [Rhodospirillales bacterium]